MYIPEIGESFTLDDLWTFSLWGEHRNRIFLEQLCLKGYISEADILNCAPKRDTYGSKISTISHLARAGVPVLTVTLPIGSELSVARIYIRDRLPEYNSVTFNLLATPTQKWKKARFWVKLHEVNRIVSSTPVITTTIDSAIPATIL